MRVSLGMIVLDFPSAYGADPDDYLAKGLALRDQWREHPLVTFCLAPHAPYTVSDATFGKIAKLAAEVDVPVHIHLHETEDEIRRSLAEHGVRPLERLRRLGLLGPRPDRGACRACRRGRDRAAGEARRLGGALPVVQPEARERLRAGGADGGRGRQPGHRQRRRGEQQPPGRVRRNAARCAACQGGRGRRRGHAGPCRAARGHAGRRDGARPGGAHRLRSSPARPPTWRRCGSPGPSCRPATTPCRISSTRPAGNTSATSGWRAGACCGTEHLPMQQRIPPSRAWTLAASCGRIL